MSDCSGFVENGSSRFREQYKIRITKDPAGARDDGCSSGGSAALEHGIARSLSRVLTTQARTEQLYTYNRNAAAALGFTALIRRALRNRLAMNAGAIVTTHQATACTLGLATRHGEELAAKGINTVRFCAQCRALRSDCQARRCPPLEFV